jgi:hypothetical protein
MLFYWWPVWAVGFLMAVLTWLDGHRLAIVPTGTTAVEGAHVQGLAGPRDALVLPPGGERLPSQPGTQAPQEPNLRIAKHSGYGMIFIVVLLLVIFITNVPIRGMASWIVVIMVVFLSIIFALQGWWDPILEALAQSRAYLNAFAYVVIAVPLFLLWLAVILVFDRQVYMVFAPGQMRVHQNIGDAEGVVDTHGMVVTKRRSDLFRHWLLGMGSGDLVVKTAGANSREFQLSNVLFVGSKLEMIQQMIQQREVIGTG